MSARVAVMLRASTGSLALWVVSLIVPVIALLAAYLPEQASPCCNRRVREINSQITGDFNEGITGAKTIKDPRHRGAKDGRRLRAARPRTCARPRIRSRALPSDRLHPPRACSGLHCGHGAWCSGAAAIAGAASEVLMQIATLSAFTTYALSALIGADPDAWCA
ncbi:MAG: hypothetical protein ACLU9S_12900 [Oscillospiraceae bacterium]